ncbi:hypothetical protein KBB48_03720 [Candidatus Shapirobacteria bacterium]|nr:hypothetical protein [Candidatus Shapirobacteria bacterium]
MAGEFEEKMEGKTSGGSVKSTSDDITLQKAVDMGEYNPDYLSTFPEWHKLSRIMRWQMIRSAIKNRRKFLQLQWAEINNQLDYSQKPYLKLAGENIQKQLTALTEDEEKYQVEYSI